MSLPKKLVEYFKISNSIQKLNLSHNCLYSKEMDLVIASIIGNNKTIKQLNLSWNSLGDGCLKTLPENTSLEILSVTRNELTDVCTQFIAKNQHLIELSIDRNNITDLGLKNLSVHPTLKLLNVRENDITAEGALVLFNSQLEEINLEFCSSQDHMKKAQFDDLFEEIKQIRSLIAEEYTVIDDSMYL